MDSVAVRMTQHHFYAVQTTSGHENKVRNLIQRKIDADPTPASERMIRQALVPTEQAVVASEVSTSARPRTFAHYNLAGIYERRGDKQAALRHLKVYRTLTA